MSMNSTYGTPLAVLICSANQQCPPSALMTSGKPVNAWGDFWKNRQREKKSPEIAPMELQLI
jgi:hypothetical protein